MEWEYKKITYAMMKDYIKTNCLQDKDWFTSVALTTDEKGEKHYQHLKAKRAFCEKYMPELIPIGTNTKVNAKDDLLGEW